MTLNSDIPYCQFIVKRCCFRGIAVVTLIAPHKYILRYTASSVWHYTPFLDSHVSKLNQWGNQSIGYMSLDNEMRSIVYLEVIQFR